MARTLRLNKHWDLCLNPAGRIAVTPDANTPVVEADAHALAQNVANTVRLFTRDAHFNQENGLPHYDLALGQDASESRVKHRLRQAALSVPGIAEARVALEKKEGRVLGGDIQLTLNNRAMTNITV